MFTEHTESLFPTAHLPISPSLFAKIKISMRTFHFPRLTHHCSLITIIATTLIAQQARSLPADEPSAFQDLFNGKDLTGWQGRESLWSVQDGTIVGQTTADAPIKANTFLVWQGGEVTDFEFHCKVRFDQVNSGVQYRSALVDQPNLALMGYQADLHPRANYMGMMYGEKTGRGIIATGGQRVVIPAKGKPSVVDQLVPLKNPIATEWNELRIIAVGNRMIHQINGTTTVDVTDNHPDARLSGLLGLQLHKGVAMKAEFRDLRLRKLSGAAAISVLSEAIAATKTVAATEAPKDTPNVGVK